MISSGVEIMQSSIRDSTILSNSKIGTLSQISGSLIGRNSVIGGNSRLTNVIVGHDSVIPPGTTIMDTTWENQ
jgi:ADP-glucose pyrophosphorylase